MPQTEKDKRFESFTRYEEYHNFSRSSIFSLIEAAMRDDIRKRYYVQNVAPYGKDGDFLVHFHERSGLSYDDPNLKPSLRTIYLYDSDKQTILDVLRTSAAPTVKDLVSRLEEQWERHET